MSNSPRAHEGHGTGSARPTPPPRGPPDATPLPAGASRTRPSDSCPSTSRSSPGGAQPYSPPTISMSVPHTPSATPSTSSSPSRACASGISVISAEPFCSGMTVSARIARSLTGRRLAADRRQHLARVVARLLVRREEDVRRRDLVRLRRPPHRHLLAELLDLLLVECRPDQRRPDRPGRDAVHADLAVDQRLRQRHREHVDPALRGGVVDQRLVAPQSVHRPGVDDRRALPHVLERLVRRPPRAVQVGLERAVPDLARDLLGRVDRRLRAGVVHEDVDPPELLDGLRDYSARLVLVLHVAAQRDRAPPLGLDEPGRVLRVVLLGQVGDRHVGALLRERRADGAADARGPAGHERGLAVELAGAPVGPHLVLRLRLHLALVAGPLLLLRWEFLFV